MNLPMMKLPTSKRAVFIGVAVITFGLVLAGVNIGGDETPTAEIISPPVLSVSMIQVEEMLLPLRVPVSDNIVAWQEASISAESEGLKLIEVNVNVGDVVKRGQILARFNTDIIEAELAEAKAAVAKAKAAMIEADLNFSRAKTLATSNAISAQYFDQTKVAAMTARAQLNATHAIAKKNQLRQEQALVLAPSDGAISSHTATVGSAVPVAQELFRLIEDGRLEWRAAVATAEMEKLTPSQIVVITAQNHQPVQGTLRMIAPTIDVGTHTGLVYIDLPPNTALRSSIFARGYIEVSDDLALTLPQRAVMLRDGFHYVMQVDAQSHVTLKKISVGRQINDLH